MMAMLALEVLPLTLTLSPQAGRGDVPSASPASAGDGAAYPFSPRAGRRWRQDEGQMPASTVAAMSANLNAISQEA